MPGNAHIQTLQRGVRILYAVAGVEDGLTPNQIASVIQVKPATVYKFIRTLEAEHLLVRRKSPLRYVLGHAVTELKTLDDQRHLLTVSGKILIRTYAKLPEANFALIEHEPPYTYQRFCVESQRPGVLVRRREFQQAPYTKASSLLFLAYSHPDEVENYFRTFPFELHGKPSWKSMARLNEFLAGVRRTRISLPDFPESGFGGSVHRLAVPIFSRGGEVIAAIGGYQMTEEPVRTRKILLRLCQEAAQEIMDSL